MIPGLPPVAVTGILSKLFYHITGRLYGYLLPKLVIAVTVRYIKLPVPEPAKPLIVISAIAIKQTMACCAKLESPVPALAPFVTIETVVACAFMIYVYIRFMMFIFGGKKTG